MNELLGRILDAHGGMDRWNGYEKVDATIVSGGGFFALKGVLQDSNPRRMTVWLHEECLSAYATELPSSETGPRLVSELQRSHIREHNAEEGHRRDRSRRRNR